MILETEGIAILVCKSLYSAAFLEVLSLYMIAYLKEKHKTVPQILKKIKISHDKEKKAGSEQ